MGTEKIRIGIYGFGNLGKGVMEAIKRNPDMELAAIFTRRDPDVLASQIKDKVTVIHVDNIELWVNKIDVMICCGGSATDLPVQTPMLAKWFNVIDSFDTHAKIFEHLEKVGTAARAGGNIAIISLGWDPGMFSLHRMMAAAILPGGKDYTFWGKGVSQGHSDAIRRIKGVKDARQYTIPVEEAVERVRKGENPALTTREKHTRECFVVAEEGADKARIEKEIVTMPNYFEDYETTVNFVSEEELLRDHAKLPHGGNVLYCGETGEGGEGHKHVIEYGLKLDSNPEFTGSVIVAYARAAYRMNKKGEIGAKTIFDVAPSLLSAEPYEEMLKKL